METLVGHAGPWALWQAPPGGPRGSHGVLPASWAPRGPTLPRPMASSRNFPGDPAQRHALQPCA